MFAADLVYPRLISNLPGSRRSQPEATSSGLEFVRRDRALFFDLDKKTVDYLPGVVLPLKPFWGVMGVAPPAAMGRVLSGPPNVFGGNMDNKDLGAGSTLYLPVHVSGALLSIGDGHAAQGHGEVCLSAIEASLKGEVQVILHKGKRITWPRGETNRPGRRAPRHTSGTSLASG